MRFLSYSAVVLVLSLSPVAKAGAIVLTEGFDDIGTLGGAGWVQTNNSAPIGTTGWFQGNTGVFSSQSGAANSYIAANFDNADFNGNISNWLLLPALTLSNSVSLTFYTRTENPQIAPDRLEVRMSTNGASTNVGGTAATVGDFTTLLLTINPTLTTSGYPSDWTQFTVNVTGVAVATTGRLAFRYIVPNTSLNADFIGIDSVVVNDAAAGVPEPTSLGLAAAGLAILVGGLKRRSLGGKK